MRPRSGATDEELARAVAHDPAAFTELYRRYSGRVYRFVRSRSIDHSTAEDIAAQVFFRCLRSSATFRGDASYETWLFCIARNCIATWRRAARRTPVPVAELPEIEDDKALSPTAHVLAEEMRERIREAILEMPSAQREIALCRYAEGLQGPQVRAASHRTPGAERVLLHRARARLHKSLASEVRE